MTFSQPANSRGKSFKVEGVYQESNNQFHRLVEKEDQYAEEKNAELHENIEAGKVCLNNNDIC